MTRIWLSLMIALAVNAAVNGQTAQQRYATRTDRVVITAVVVDQDDRVVSGLQQSDFVVLEDGRPREIRHFETGKVPVSVAVLLDACNLCDGGWTGCPPMGRQRCFAR